MLNNKLKLTPPEIAERSRVIITDDDGCARLTLQARDAIEGNGCRFTKISPSLTRETYSLKISLSVVDAISPKENKLCIGNTIKAIVPFLPLEKELSADCLEKYAGYLVNELSNYSMAQIALDPVRYGFLEVSETEEIMIPEPYPFFKQIEVVIRKHERGFFQIIEVNGEPVKEGVTPPLDL